METIWVGSQKKVPIEKTSCPTFLNNINRIWKLLLLTSSFQSGHSSLWWVRKGYPWVFEDKRTQKNEIRIQSLCGVGNQYSIHHEFERSTDPARLITHIAMAVMYRRNCILHVLVIKAKDLISVFFDALISYTWRQGIRSASLIIIQFPLLTTLETMDEQPKMGLNDHQCFIFIHMVQILSGKKKNRNIRNGLLNFNPLLHRGGTWPPLLPKFEGFHCGTAGGVCKNGNTVCRCPCSLRSTLSKHVLGKKPGEQMGGEQMGEPFVQTSGFFVHRILWSVSTVRNSHLSSDDGRPHP